MNSVNGTISQIPLTPKNWGKTIIPIINNIKVLIIESIADILPLENAVNIPQVNILNPLTKNPIEKILKPFKDILKTLLSFEVNDEIKVSDIKLDNTKEVIEKIKIII